MPRLVFVPEKVSLGLLSGRHLISKLPLLLIFRPFFCQGLRRLVMLLHTNWVSSWLNHRLHKVRLLFYIVCRLNGTLKKDGVTDLVWLSRPNPDQFRILNLGLFYVFVKRSCSISLPQMILILKSKFKMVGLVNFIFKILKANFFSHVSLRWVLRSCMLKLKFDIYFSILYFSFLFFCLSQLICSLFHV